MPTKPPKHFKLNRESAKPFKTLLQAFPLNTAWSLLCHIEATEKVSTPWEHQLERFLKIWIMVSILGLAIRVFHIPV